MPASARQSVSPSGGKMRPVAISVAQRSPISLTGGNTLGFTTPLRLTTSQSARNASGETSRPRRLTCG